MVSVGSNIKLLRKAKGVTQEELAGALNISYQAVSKWENNAAQPDIAMIPALADYFGVTIDDLFGFKLNALTDKERFIKFMADIGVLKFGDFELSAGGGSGYYIDSERFTTNAQHARLGEFFADCIRENHIDFDTLVGMAYHGIGFSAATAIALYHKYGVTVNYCYDRKMSDSRGRMLCGHTLEAGEKIVIVDDLISSGRTLSRRIEKLLSIAKVEIAAIVVIVDRKETGEDAGAASGAERIRQEYGTKVFSVVNGEDIMHAMKSGII